jgi:hypothetical protein
MRAGKADFAQKPFPFARAFLFYEEQQSDLFLRVIFLPEVFS